MYLLYVDIYLSADIENICAQRSPYGTVKDLENKLSQDKDIIKGVHF